MAKIKTRPNVGPPKPAYSPGYTWMLLLTVLAMAGGSALLYLELDGDYGFSPEPKGLPPVPKVEPLRPRDAPLPKLN